MKIFDLLRGSVYEVFKVVDLWALQIFRIGQVNGIVLCDPFPLPRILQGRRFCRPPSTRWS
ncbi:MAG: hypothetical protein WDO13_01400 [Verrucomicrobiota bacterium]